jgi:hypothetical protein
MGRKVGMTSREPMFEDQEQLEARIQSLLEVAEYLVCSAGNPSAHPEGAMAMAAVADANVNLARIYAEFGSAFVKKSRPF